MQFCRYGISSSLQGLRHLVLLVALSTVHVASASEAGTHRLILRLVELPAAEAAPSLAQRFAALVTASAAEGLSFERRIGATTLIARLQGTDTDLATVSEYLARHPQVIYAEPEGRVMPAFVPNDPEYVNQWFLYDTYGIRADAAWDIERGDSAIVVAVLDTGILTHADLPATRILPGYDFVSSTTYSNDGDGWDADPTDPGDAVAANECGAGEPAESSSWHGLHLAGVVAATTDNAQGVAGINHGSRLLPVRVLGKCGGSFADVISAILWSAGLSVGGVPANPTPARIINLSFGGIGVCTPAVQDAIDRAVAAGAVVVAAAGNNNQTDVAGILPAGCDNVITIAATNRAGGLTAYSNLGDRVLVSAPGGENFFGIRSVYNTGTTAPAADSYANLIGTSFASAQASAAISLMLSAQPGLTLADVREILRRTAQAFPAGGCVSNACGAGILDAAAAVQLASTTTPGTFGSTPTSTTGTSSGGGGGGGGGCVLTSRSDDRIDVVFAVVIAASALRLLRRRTVGC